MLIIATSTNLTAWRTLMFNCATALSVWCCLVTGATAAGTAYAVDTAEVGDAGSCKIEAWGSKARNGDIVVTANPSCIIEFGKPVEISLQGARTRESGEWATSYSPKAKVNLVPTAIGRPGFAAVVGTVYDPALAAFSQDFAYIPATLRLSEVVRINANAGWLHDRPSDRHLATWGIAVDWKFTTTLTWTGEAFGEIGRADEPSQTHPRFQTGVRYRPSDPYSFDIIWGRNINGEGSSWVTLSTTLRFSAD